jgi:hypothetical protein
MKLIEEPPYWEIPRCWPGETVAILGGGSSLKQEQAEYLRGKCRVIAINRAGLASAERWVHVPWADWLYGCDADRFWAWHPEALEFPGVKIAVRGCGDGASMRVVWPKLAELSAAGVKILRHSSRDFPCVPRHEGVSGDPAVVRGNNSAFQILSVIQWTGAATVLLLGIDMKGGHWHEGYIASSPTYTTAVLPMFESLVKPLREAGIAVFNCSPKSILPFWPKVSLESII